MEFPSFTNQRWSEETWLITFRGLRLWKNVLRLYLSGRGVMRCGVPETSAFAPIDSNSSWPDLQLCISPFSFELSSKMSADAGPARTGAEPGITIVGLYLRPKSRGVVSIRSNRFDDPPKIDANWLSEPHDRTALVSSVQYMRRFMARPALQHFVGEETAPGADVQTHDEVFKTFRTSFSSGLHGAGTCQKGGRARASSTSGCVSRA